MQFTRGVSRPAPMVELMRGRDHKGPLDCWGIVKDFSLPPVKMTWEFKADHDTYRLTGKSTVTLDNAGRWITVTTHDVLVDTKKMSWVHEENCTRNVGGYDTKSEMIRRRQQKREW